MKNKKLILLTMLMSLTSLSSFATSGKGSDGENGNTVYKNKLEDTKYLTFYNNEGKTRRVSPIMETYDARKVDTYSCSDSHFQINRTKHAKLVDLYRTRKSISLLSIDQTVYAGSYRHVRGSKYCFKADSKVSKRELEQEINNNYLLVTDRFSSYYDQLVQLLGGLNYFEEFLIREKYAVEIYRFNAQAAIDLGSKEGSHNGPLDMLNSFVYVDKIAEAFNLQTSRFTQFSASLDVELIERSNAFYDRIKLTEKAYSELDKHIKQASRYLPGTDGWSQTIEGMRIFWSQSAIRSFYNHFKPTYLEVLSRINQHQDGNPQITKYERAVYNYFPGLERIVETYGLN